MALIGEETFLPRTLNDALNILLPIYLQRAASNDSPGPEKTTARVSFVDGLRGYASFIVFVSHFLEPFEPAKRFGYGFGEDNNSFLQLPIIRLLYSGVPMVAIFFIISGYALSYKPLLVIQHDGQLSDTLASAIFRRGIRLFLPTIASTFLVMVTVRLRLQDSLDYSALPGVIEPRPRRFASAREQFTDWSRFVVAELTNPWDWRIGDYAYDSHLWTIPIEFRASLILFLVLACTAKIRRVYRLAISTALWAHCMWYGMWHVALFISGMFFADLAVRAGSSIVTPNRYWHLLISFVPLVLGLLLLSFPIRNGDKTPGYVFLSRVSLNYNTWHALGAILVLWALHISLSLQKIFVTSFARYLGKVSFALYIVHGPALHSVGYDITCYICGLGEEAALPYRGGLLLGFLLVMPIVFRWADVFERLVDQPTVKLAKWLYWKARVE